MMTSIVSTITECMYGKIQTLTRHTFMAVDVALGRGRDYSAFQIIDLYSGEQVAEFYSNTTPINEFAKICFDEGNYYNLCPVLVERNTIGNNLLDYLFEQVEYENVWFDEKQQMGLQVTAKNRDTILVEMEEAIRMNEVKINSKRTVMELNTFIISDNGKVKADTGQNDDLSYEFSTNYIWWKKI